MTTQKQWTKEEIRYLLYSVLVMFIIIGVGLFIVNQYMAFRYKAVFLKEPLALGMELNPDVKCYLENQNPYLKDRDAFQTTHVNYSDILKNVQNQVK